MCQDHSPLIYLPHSAVVRHSSKLRATRGSTHQKDLPGRGYRLKSILEDVKLYDGWVVKAEMQNGMEWIIKKSKRMAGITDEGEWCSSPFTAYSEMAKKGENQS